MNLARTTQGVCIADTPPRFIPSVLGIGRNYAAHAAEQGLPAPEHLLVFSKSTRSLALHNEPIVVPKACQDRDQVDYEGELVVILARDTKDVSEADALSHVLGYACANDVSARWWQRTGSSGQFYLGKSFDTFCPLGPSITPAADIPDPHALRLQTYLNGDLVQDAPTSDMSFSIPSIISRLSQGATLPAGTVILTGTPSGVGQSRTPPRFLQDGDRIDITIDPIGTLSNTVRYE